MGDFHIFYIVQMVPNRAKHHGYILVLKIICSFILSQTWLWPPKLNVQSQFPVPKTDIKNRLKLNLSKHHHFLLIIRFFFYKFMLTSHWTQNVK